MHVIVEASCSLREASGRKGNVDLEGSVASAILKYGLLLLSAGSNDPLELSESEFQSVRSARVSYLTTVDIEEKFDLTVESYFDFERTRIDLAFRHMLTWDLPQATLSADIRVINRRLLGLLAAGKLYLDQLGHDFVKLYGRSSKWAAIEQKRRSLQDGSLGFQVAKVLRDHIQHRGLPVNTLFYQMTAKNEDGQRRILVGTDPHLNVYQLEGDRAVDRSLLKKLRDSGRSLSVTPIVKEYLGCLGELHEAVREVISSDADSWEAELQAFLRRAEAAFGPSPIVAAVELQEDGSYDEDCQVFEDMLGLRSILLKKNALLKNLADRFVSAETARREA